MKDSIEIRPIQPADAESIMKLSQELGYQLGILDLAQQINNIIEQADHFAFVAIIEKKLVGYIHVFIAYRLTCQPFLEIGGLVVSENYRHQGIGSSLVRHIESIETPCKSVRVRCNTRRIEAHKFYENLGYTEKKTQKIFGLKI